MRLHQTTMLLFMAIFPAANHSQQPQPDASLREPRRDVQVLLSDYNRSIHILNTGLLSNWTPEQYTNAFNDPLQHLSACKASVTLLLNRPHTVWDERLPFDVEIQQITKQCVQMRDLLLNAGNSYPPTSQ